MPDASFESGQLDVRPAAAFLTTRPARDARARLLDLSVGLVEDLHRVRASPDPGPEDFCPDFQVCLPYRGLFVWHVCGDEVVGDPNQIVFVRGGEPYRMRAPIAGGYSELVITPAPDVLGEIVHAKGRGPGDHPLFRRRSLRAQPRLQRLSAQFRHRAAHRQLDDELEAEELVVALLRSAFQHAATRTAPTSARTAGLIRRTKAFLAAHLATRILLTDISRAVGASPAYLTDLFTRVEGISLHQYLTQLRLARALAELHHADDLTTLALETGFSSHSHFAYAFRRAFGSTPSAFRASARRSATARRAACRPGLDQTRRPTVSR